ncbi:MAG: hypothetical protein KAT16_09340 [Candidatus Heimdallarchaeota archaeon]|nr:hypothetical protein [Candidatus Heimdallarchaeota archaeon]
MELTRQNITLFMVNLYKSLVKDRILIFAIVIVSLLTISNVANKLLFGFEPLQYSFFSYDKILHLLSSIIIVRVLYRFITLLESPYEINHPKLVASVLTMVIYGLLWEPFELFTFIIQESISDQFLNELFDVPLDWLWDAAGVLLSYILGYD